MTVCFITSEIVKNEMRFENLLGGEKKRIRKDVLLAFLWRTVKNVENLQGSQSPG
jgi:hypothetical protein